jgi:hypothetical protein
MIAAETLRRDAPQESQNLAVYRLSASQFEQRIRTSTQATGRGLTMESVSLRGHCHFWYSGYEAEHNKWANTKLNSMDGYGGFFLAYLRIRSSFPLRTVSIL